MTTTTKCGAVCVACLVAVIAMAWIAAALPHQWAAACVITGGIFMTVAAVMAIVVFGRLMDGKP